MIPQVVRPVRGLAFDVDGTLANTDAVHAEAWASALQSVSGGQLDVQAYLQASKTGQIRPRQFLSSTVTNREWDLVATEKHRIYRLLLAAGVPLTPGLDSLLMGARTFNIPIAVVSSGSPESVQSFIDELWPGPPPDVIVTRADTPWAKPDPAPYLLAAERLALPASGIVAFEDSPAGVFSAREAGLTCVRMGPRGEALVALRVADFRACELSGTDGVLQLRIKTLTASPAND